MQPSKSVFQNKVASIQGKKHVNCGWEIIFKGKVTDNSLKYIGIHFGPKYEVRSE